MNIPKKIHFTSSDLIHPIFKKNIQKIKDEHIDWEIKHYTDKDIIEFISKNYDKKFLSIYEKLNPDYGPARSDFFRYLLMFKIGGVYLDIKSSLEKNLNEIILEDDSYLLSHWGKSFPNWGKHPLLKGQSAFQQWFIICQPFHPFLGLTISNIIERIKNYNPIIHGVGKHGVLNVTGTVLYTKSILKLIDFYDHRLFESEKNGLVYSIIKSNNKLEHQKYFNKHYSLLKSPIVLRNNKNLTQKKIKKSESNKLSNNFRIFKNFNVSFNLSPEPSKLVVVCSHERSGTHFFMNSVSLNTNYLNNPIFDFDKFSRNTNFNVFDENKLKKLFEYILGFKNNGKKLYFKNLIKTHFDALALKPVFNLKNIQFFYIIRNPIETLSSYWKFNQKYLFDKNVIDSNFRKFLSSKPSGRSMLTHLRPAKNYYYRWEQHTESWLNASMKYKNIYIVKYENLDENYEYEFRKAALKIVDKTYQKIVRPNFSNFYKGANVLISDKDMTDAKSFINKKLIENETIQKIFN